MELKKFLVTKEAVVEAAGRLERETEGARQRVSRGEGAVHKAFPAQPEGQEKNERGKACGSDFRKYRRRGLRAVRAA